MLSEGAAQQAPSIAMQSRETGFTRSVQFFSSYHVQGHKSNYNNKIVIFEYF